eukprot:comp16810_c0_seq1/m.15210 comp16810_c0_seq1/g.15210  ORF comp16810_c0_seq1/g.15210 comp16810_c0_seq1/m.15210 type:complete len:113 (-) comp16810_c0_seq1:597-935(-)
MLNVLRGFLRGARRGPLSPKQGNKNFYKGYGAKSTGWHTRKGGYMVSPLKIPEFIIPDLTGFKLKAYVYEKVPKLSVRPISWEAFKEVDDAQRAARQKLKEASEPAKPESTQ